MEVGVVEMEMEMETRGGSTRASVRIAWRALAVVRRGDANGTSEGVGATQGQRLTRARKGLDLASRGIRPRAARSRRPDQVRTHQRRVQRRHRVNVLNVSLRPEWRVRRGVMGEEGVDARRRRERDSRHIRRSASAEIKISLSTINQSSKRHPSRSTSLPTRWVSDRRASRRRRGRRVSP